MKRGGCVLITQPQAMQQARSVCGGGEGEGEGEVVEQQIRALGNPRSSFSSSSSSLCIRRGFDNKFHSRQCRTPRYPSPATPFTKIVDTLLLIHPCMSALHLDTTLLIHPLPRYPALYTPMYLDTLTLYTPVLGYMHDMEV